MFRSGIEAATRAWLLYEPLTLLHSYEALQKSVIGAYAPYRDIVEHYSKTSGRNVRPITYEYLEENPEVAEQNVALLKNAMELWRAASQTSTAVAPMLYHYSWHCFNSFFIYTFFRWEPQHSRSHGIQAPPEDNIEDIKIRFLNRKDGLFQRLIDTWTLLGVHLAFSPFLPVCQKDKIKFVPNNRSLLNRSNKISLKQLLAFDSASFKRELDSDRREELLTCHFLVDSIEEPTEVIKGYLIVFVASNLARYRPILWNSVLVGKTREQSNLALRWRKALFDYTTGRDINGLLFQISTLLTSIRNEKFFFMSKSRKRI